MSLHVELRSGLLISPNAWRPLAVGSSLLNRQDAKDAKVGFMELSRLCGYKALS